MLSNKQPSFYPILILFTLAITSFTLQPSITLNQDTTTYAIDDISIDDGSYIIQPEFTNESYLFLPLSQVEFSTAHMFTTENFKFHQVHVGAKYHYYQTDKHVLMGKIGDSGLKFTNYAEISVPDIIFSQQKCTHLAVDPREIYSISACTDTSDNSVYLIMVSYVSSRPTYVQSLKTSIKGVSQMKLVGKFLYVLDHDDATNTNNKLHIYKINIGGNTVAKEAMDIVGYIDQSPFGADKLDIGSFDVPVFETTQRIFMADKNFGLRAIDIHTEDIKLYNAFSNPIANNIVSVAVHTCDAKSCYLVVSSNSSIGYASWGRNGNSSAFDFISAFNLPKHVTINEKLTVKNNFLAVMSQADEANRLHFFSIPAGKFVNLIPSVGAISYQPVSSYQNDFFIDCANQEGDSCKLFVPNPVNHLEEYILRPHFAVRIKSQELKSTYFNLVPRFNPSSPTKKVMINKPGQAQSPVPSIAPRPTGGLEPVVEAFSEQEAYIKIIEQFKPISKPVFPVVTGKYLQQQVNAAQQARLYGAPKRLQASSSSSDSSDDDESLTTFHGWFIIFLIILGILAAVAYFTNKPEEKAPASRNANVVEPPSSFSVAPSVVDQPLRAPLIESTSEAQVVDVHYRRFEDKFEENLENQGNTEEPLLKVDTGLENDTQQIDLEASQ